ncbi:structural maintenance of chromosomes protein 6 [[Candida] anglica]
MTVPENRGQKRAASSLGSDLYDPQNGNSVNDFVSQRLESKRLRMTQYGSDSEEESGSGSSGDSGSDSGSDSEGSGDEEEEEDGFSSPAQAGIIERISLKNFMCHDSFELDLGPQLNFIIGRNGSGKSAILTGISVGLGAKATDTSRGSSIKSLIKDGRSTARVSITLKNEGPEAYQPEIYGKKIVVERKFQRQGTNTYYLKDVNGKTISNKKAHLDEMLYKFNITVDNPLAFLSQDKAREFLTATTDRIKHDYFMSGALINDILENYRVISQNIVEVQSKLKMVRTDLEVALNKYEESSKVYNKFKKSDNLRRELELTNGKMYWFNVEIIEKKCERYIGELEENKREEEELKRRLEEVKLKSEGYENKRKELEELKEQEEKQYQESLETVGQLKEEVKQIKNGIGMINEEIKTYLEEIEVQKVEKRKYRHELKKEQEKIDEINGGSKEKLNEKLRELRGELSRLEREKEVVVGKLQKMVNEKDGGHAVKEAASKMNGVQETIEQLKEKRKQLMSLQKDKYIAWGHGINAVLTEIKNPKHDWHEVPVGPIGSYISVKKQFGEWKDLLNASFGKTLDSFLVHDDHDRRILEGILKRNRMVKNIITRRFEKFNFGGGKVQGYTTVLDALEIGNENVLYTLVDTNNVERNVLGEKRGDVSEILRTGGGHLVMNVFTLLDQRSGHRSSENGGTFRIDPIFYRSNEPHKFSREVEGDTKEELKGLEVEINEELSKVNELQREYRRLKMNQQNEIQELEQNRGALDKQIRKYNDEIFSIENKLGEDGDLSVLETLEEKIGECDTQIRQREGFITSLEEDRKGDVVKFNVAKERYVAGKEDVETREAKMKGAKQALEEFETNHEVLMTETSKLKQSMERRSQNIVNLEGKLVKGREALSKHKGEAEAKCSRSDVTIDENDTVESITQDYTVAQEAVKESERSIGRTYEEIQQELLDNKRRKDELEATAMNLDTISRSLDDDLNQRLKYLQTTILKSIREASSSFEQSLALRGFKGELKFGFTEKTLTMLVQTKGDSKKRTVESLSGGEKSFTQIALLLAIWKAMNSKIRGLDEFDVFMDSVNRSISIKLLLTELRKYPKSQSIFITPQDIAMVGDLDNSDVKIHRMDNPRGI